MFVLCPCIHPENRFNKTTECGRRLVLCLFSKRGGENKKGLFTREKSGHHVSDAIASCFYLVVFSKRGKNTSRVWDGESWLRCLCLISWGFF